MVAHFSSVLAGGAGIAAQRLHLALNRAGYTSRMYFGNGEAVDATMIPAYTNRSFFWRNAAALAVSWRNRCEAPGGFVTSPRWIRRTPVQGFGPVSEIVNLHWVARWLDLPSFFGSLPDSLPVVWSLHDLIPITGGCHYPGDCDHFARQCGDCPQQRKPGTTDATNKFFHIKEKCYAGKNLHFVGNSEWTSAQIRRSGWQNMPGRFAPSIWDWMWNSSSRWKKFMRAGPLGFLTTVLWSASPVRILPRNAKEPGCYARQSSPLPAKMFCCSHLVRGIGRNPATLRHYNWERLNNPRLQSLFYSALDVFVTPSRVETFGNTTMEAMACETPVAAYATSGLVDVVADGETGLLERDIGSVPGLARMLNWMQQHPVERRQMGMAGRQRVIRNFTDTLMADRYSKFYGEISDAGTKLVAC